MTAAIIFILAFLIRIPRLDTLPLNHDEANWILPCVNNFDKLAGIPVACFQGYVRPFLSYLVLFTKKLSSSPAFIVRFPSVVVGVATVILIYQLAKEMYGREAGLISSLLLCFLPWHIIQSRNGVEPVLAPFFGCLIFLALFKAIRKKSNPWFLFSCFSLSIGAFYTYQASLLFIPIFLTVVLWLRKDLSWLKTRIILLCVLIFFLILYPIVHLQAAGRLPQYLALEMFNADIFIKLFINLKYNAPAAFKALFLNSSDYFLYGRALKSPLLINGITLFVILFSICLSFWRRRISDKLLLVWLGLGFFVGLSGVKHFQARYIIIILPPVLIFIGKFIAEIFVRLPQNSFAKRGALLVTGLALLGGLIVGGLVQWTKYYYISPFNFEECRSNSYGCKEAAQYLIQTSNIENYNIITAPRMTVRTYLDYMLGNKGNPIKAGTMNKKSHAYYILWAPESHPPDYWGGLFRNPYDFFKNKYPDEAPIKVIYYPNGQAAVYIFRIGLQK